MLREAMIYLILVQDISLAIMRKILTGQIFISSKCTDKCAHMPTYPVYGGRHIHHMWTKVFSYTWSKRVGERELSTTVLQA